MSFIETDKRHPIMWRKMITNEIRSYSRANHVNSSREKDIY